MDDTVPEVPPYTGRTDGTSDPVLPAPEVLAASLEPRIRWGRMAIVQIASGIVVAFVLPLVLLLTSGGDYGYLLGIVLLVALLIGVVGGGLPYLLARVAHSIVTISGRGATREVLAVAGGAFLGSALLAVVGVLFTGAPSALLIVLIVGVPSAIGFSVWVLVAWWPHLQNRPVR